MPLALPCRPAFQRGLQDLVSLQAGRDLRLDFEEALFGVESCMERCFLKPTDFVGAAIAAASLLGLA